MLFERLPHDVQGYVYEEWLSATDTTMLWLAAAVPDPQEVFGTFDRWLKTVKLRLRPWTYLLARFKTPVSLELEMIVAQSSILRRACLTVFQKYQCHQAFGLRQECMMVMDTWAMRMVRPLAAQCKSIAYKTCYPPVCIRDVFPNATELVITHHPCASTSPLTGTDRIRLLHLWDDAPVSPVYEKYRLPIHGEWYPEVCVIHMHQAHPLQGVFPAATHIAGRQLHRLYDHVHMDKITQVSGNWWDCVNWRVMPSVTHVELEGPLHQDIQLHMLFELFPNLKVLDLADTTVLLAHPPTQYPATLQVLFMPTLVPLRVLSNWAPFYARVNGWPKEA